MTVSAVNDPPIAGVSAAYVDPNNANYLDAALTALDLTGQYFPTGSNGLPTPYGNDGELTFFLAGQDVDNTQDELVARVQINDDPLTRLGSYFQYCGGCANPVPVDTTGPSRGVVTDPGRRVLWRTLSAKPFLDAPVDMTEVLKYTLEDSSGAVSNVKSFTAYVHFTPLPVDLPPPPPPTTTTTSPGSTPVPTYPPTGGCEPFCGGF